MDNQTDFRDGSKVSGLGMADKLHLIVDKSRKVVSKALVGRDSDYVGQLRAFLNSPSNSDSAFVMFPADYTLAIYDMSHIDHPELENIICLVDLIVKKAN